MLMLSLHVQLTSLEVVETTLHSKKLIDPCTLSHRPFVPLQDEYCEWSVARNDEGKIAKITLTSEGPEYWQFLASSQPDTVVEVSRLCPPESSLELLNDVSLQVLQIIGEGFIMLIKRLLSSMHMHLFGSTALAADAVFCPPACMRR